MRELRDYQVAAVEEFAARYRSGKKKGILCLPTGAGKTAAAMEMARRTLANGRKVLFVADRNILVEQFYREALRWDLDPGLIRAASFTDPDKPFQIASKGTYASRVIQRKRLDPPPADLLICDECHRVPGSSWLKILKQYPGAYVCGLTATPMRPKGTGLGDYFDFIVEPVKVSNLIERKFLVPARCYSPTFPDLDQLKTRAGDFDKAELAKRMTRSSLVGQVTTWWKKLAQDRPTLTYGVGIDHSLWLRDQYVRAGIRARHVDGTTEDAELVEVFGEFQDGKLSIICCADLMTEGVDLPITACLQIVRPTKSLRLARQMYGRAMRPYLGKTDFTIIDHAGVVYLHGFPEDDIAWSIEPTGIPLDQKRRQELLLAGEKPPSVCPECFCVYRQSPVCPACGHKRVRWGMSPGNDPGTLSRVFRDAWVKARPPAEKVPVRFDPVGLAREWEQALAQAANRGGTWGMACSIFKSRTLLLPWEVGVIPLPQDNNWKRPVAADMPKYVRRRLSV